MSIILRPHVVIKSMLIDFIGYRCKSTRIVQLIHTQIHIFNIHALFRYHNETELREEGGTPAIVESIRAGLVFQLKDAITHDVIMKRELILYRCVQNTIYASTC